MPSKKPKKSRKPAIPHAERKKREPHAECGANKKQSDGLCTNPAGFRTDHPGEGKCFLHGGATPIRSGRWSQIKRPSFREKIERFEEDPDPLNLEPEIALLRAFVEDLIERWDEIFGPDGALLAWHESFNTDNPTPKPRQLPDFSSVTSLVDKVGKMVERVHRFKSEGTISLATLNRVTEQMGLDVEAAVRAVKLNADQSSRLLKAVEERWHAIRLESGSTGNSRIAAGGGENSPA